MHLRFKRNPLDQVNDTVRLQGPQCIRGQQVLRLLPSPTLIFLSPRGCGETRASSSGAHRRAGKTRFSHAKGIHLAIVLAVQLKRFLKIAVAALAADPDTFSQKLDLGGVVSGTRPQADAQHFFHRISPLLKIVSACSSTTAVRSGVVFFVSKYLANNSRSVISSGARFPNRTLASRSTSRLIPPIK